MNPVLANRILFVLSLAGAGVALYLTLAHLQVADLGCGRSGGCEKVASHWSAKGFGIPFLKAIPTAAFGLGMYVVLAGLSFGRVAIADAAVQARLGRLQWALAALGVAVTAWLTYMEAFVIHAWCRWCLASAAIITLMLLVSTAERLTPRPAPAVGGETA